MSLSALIYNLFDIHYNGHVKQNTNEWGKKINIWYNFFKKIMHTGLEFGDIIQVERSSSNK